MKKMLLLYIVTALSSPVLADGKPEDLHAEFLRKAQEEADREMRDTESKPETEVSSSIDEELAEVRTAHQGRLERDTRSLLKDLVAEVETLRTKEVLTTAALKNTQTTQTVKLRGTRTVFSYQDGQIYEILAAVDHVVDIALRPGESLSNPPTAGDTVRWSIGTMLSGQGEARQTHLILKPLEHNIETNLIVTTDERVYHMRVKSGETHMPSVSWNYPMEERKALDALAAKERTQEPAVNLNAISFDYTISGHKGALRPTQVFDDGAKTFLRMPKEIQSREAPALFVIEGGEPLLVNYRVRGEYYIVDRLFEEAELRIGQDISVTIEHGTRSFWDSVF